MFKQLLIAGSLFLDIGLWAGDNLAPKVKLLTGFEEKNPFEPGTVVSVGATEGKHALRFEKSWVGWEQMQDWSGYDYLKVDLFTNATEPLPILVEIRDSETRDYWTRLNYTTVCPPGASTLVLSLDQLFVGEKSRPGRNVRLDAIKCVVFAFAEEKPAGFLCLDNIRLERETAGAAVRFDGLHAFDFGSATSPLMPGFTRITPATRYSTAQGFGLKGARIWRTFDALQPDPLYQDVICIEEGGLSVNVPNGRYRVFVNLESPGEYWGTFQRYKNRAVLAEGREVLRETMDFAAMLKKYHRFWDTEDSAKENTFDKYQKDREKTFEVEVSDGCLDLDFRGENWACSVSAVIFYPVEKKTEGGKFLRFVENQRRFYFDNSFKRVLHQPTGDPLQPGPEERARGYQLFERDSMREIFDNDTPFKSELVRELRGSAFAGELEPVTLGIYPLRDLGRVTVTVSDLTGPGTIPSSRVDLGYVSNRLSRVTMDGSVYTIQPRLVIPRSSVVVKKDVTRRFWLTVNVPANAPAGLYKGTVSIRPEKGKAAEVPLLFQVRKGRLAEVDVPAGAWGCSIDIPWLEDDPETTLWNDSMTRKSLRKLREYGFTTCSGLPQTAYRGFKDGKPLIDFSLADKRMKIAREEGFTQPVLSYCQQDGLNLYRMDQERMKQAGFTDYSEFIKAVFGAIQEHANQENWLPVYWVLADEPLGADVPISLANLEAYRRAFPKGPPFFTACSSWDGGPNDHGKLALAAHVVNLGAVSQPVVEKILANGGSWAWYNGGNRWAFGCQMYKAVREFDLKWRIDWHWNVAAGDPFYALDCREDDYAWALSSPEGELVTSLAFERNREGIDDYRRLLTLEKLAAAKNDPTAKAFIQKRLSSFKLNDTPLQDWNKFRTEIDAQIERLVECADTSAL